MENDLGVLSFTLWQIVWSWNSRSRQCYAVCVDQLLCHSSFVVRGGETSRNAVLEHGVQVEQPLYTEAFGNCSTVRLSQARVAA